MNAMASAAALREGVKSFLAGRRMMLIGGKWVPAASGATTDIRNPATGEALASVPESQARDVDLAVTAARRAFDDDVWGRFGPSQRGKILWKIADLIDANADELAELESLNNGMPFRDAKGFGIPRASDTFRYYAGWATKIHGRTSELGGGGQPSMLGYTLREPVGVVGMIVPWNAPLMIAAWKLAPALAAGCTCILKPAEETPLTALRLGELALEAGVPPGVVNIVTGFGHTSGAAIAAHAGVDKVAFTGSTEVGRSIVAAAAANLKKVSLELGGKSPVVVFDDADLDKSIVGAARAIFNNAGQVCTAGSRLYVQKKSYGRRRNGPGDRNGPAHL
jgi:phenylacetaldehyde dehydrogenase